MFWTIDFLIVLHALYILPRALRTGMTICIACTNLVFIQSRLAINNELSITLSGFGANFLFC